MGRIEQLDLKNSDSKLLEMNKNPNLFYSKRWLSVLNKQYPFAFFSVQDADDFLIVSRVDQFGLSKIKSLPFCDYTIPSADDAIRLNVLVNTLSDSFPNLPFEMKMLLPGSFQKNEFAFHLEHTAYRHKVIISEPHTMESNMHDSFLRGVRSAKKNSLEVSVSRTKEAMNTFYEIYHHQRMNKFRKLPQPRSFFHEIWEEFMNNNEGFILEVSKDSKTLGTAIILEHKNSWYYKFGCSREEHLNLRPNNLLFYELFLLAGKRGIQEVDLGLSGLHESYKGLIRFKENMGGKAGNIYSVRLEPDNFDRSAENEFKKFTEEITKEVISQKPDLDTTDRFSSLLYPYFA